jgi:hypothetical protein
MTNTPPLLDRVLASILLIGALLCLLATIGSALLYGADGHEYQGSLLVVAVLLFVPGVFAVLAAVAVARGWKGTWLFRAISLVMLAGEIEIVRRFLE